MLLEILQNLHPLDWVPLFQGYIETMHRWNIHELFSSPISRMYGSSDIDLYFERMRSKHGETYKKGILDLLNLKYTHKYFRDLIHKHYNYDMEAMLRILNPDIFRSHFNNLRKVHTQLVRRRYVFPTHTNEGCFACGQSLPSWFPSINSMGLEVLRTQLAKSEDLKIWGKKTRNMIQTGCCSEKCFQELFRVKQLPKKGDRIPMFHCEWCGCQKLINSFEACMSGEIRIGRDGKWDLDSIECIECIIDGKYPDYILKS